MLRIRTTTRPLLLIALVASSWTWAAEPEDLRVQQLRLLEERVTLVVERGLPCTVCIRAKTGGGSGSGVIINEDGLILTAAHVTQSAGKELIVIFPDGKQVAAKPLGANRNRDAGLVQITEKGKYPFVEMGKSAILERNDWCVSLGHPGGFDPRRSPPVRLGRVLRVGGYVTTNCTLIGGDSGGPLFDLNGRVIGIHSNIGPSLSQNNHVPVDVYRNYWDRMEGGETRGKLGQISGDPNRASLGIKLSSDESEEGVEIETVLPNSPAAKQGVIKGDKLQQINETKVIDAYTVVNLLSKMKAGEEVQLKVKRSDKVLHVTAKLVKAKDLRTKKTRPKTSPPKKKAGDDKEEKKEKEDDDPIAKLLEKGKANGKRLRLSPEEIRALQASIQKRLGGGGRGQGPSSSDSYHKNILAVYQPVVAGAKLGVHPLFVKERQVGLATAVHTDGWLLTKLSLIKDKDFEVGIGAKQRIKGKLAHSDKALDLALVQVDGQKVVPVNLNVRKSVLGMFVAAVGREEDPEGIGVVSVLKRSMDASNQGFLGVNMFKVKDGIQLQRVMPRTPAAKAGLKPKDIIVSLAGKKFDSVSDFAKDLSARKPGESIMLQVIRGKDEFSTRVKLGDRDALAQMPGRQNMMNSMGGRLSKKRTGFKSVLQHDCPIDPQDCGGPLVDLSGKLVGINIARAGRVKSYAIPGAEVLEFLTPHLPKTQ